MVASLSFARVCSLNSSYQISNSPVFFFFFGFFSSVPRARIILSYNSLLFGKMKVFIYFLLFLYFPYVVNWNCKWTSFILLIGKQKAALVTSVIINQAIVWKTFISHWWFSKSEVTDFTKHILLMWIELLWPENPANTYPRHPEALDSCFDLITSHQRCIAWSPPLEIKPATTDCRAGFSGHGNSIQCNFSTKKKKNIHIFY